MDSILATIKVKLKDAINPSLLEVQNDSYLHRREGDQTHYKVIIVSDHFKDVSLVKRHQRIYRILNQEVATIHALQLHTYTKEEWEDVGKYPLSSRCSAGS